MRQLLIYISFIVLLAFPAFGQINNKTANTDSLLVTFSSKTRGYFIKVQLQFVDTSLIQFTASGNCSKKCSFSFSGHPRQIGKTQNVALPSGKNIITTEYAFLTDDHSFVFEMPDNRSSLKLMTLKINNDPKCTECLHDILVGQVVSPLQLSKQKK